MALHRNPSRAVSRSRRLLIPATIAASVLACGALGVAPSFADAAGATTSIKITAHASTTSSENSATFTVEGSDVNGNDTGDVTEDTIFTTGNANAPAIDRVEYVAQVDPAPGFEQITFAKGPIHNQTVTASYFSEGTKISQQVQVVSNPIKSAINLGRAGTFSILAGAAVTIPGSNIDGEVGALGAMTISNTMVTEGYLHNSDDLANPHSAISNSYALLKALQPTGILTSDDLGGQTIYAGVYHRAAALAMSTTVTFDAQNDPNAVFVIQGDVAMNTTAATTMLLKNGADPANIFWVTTGAATLGAASQFLGNIVTYAAVTVGAGTTFCGSAFSVPAAITLDSDKFILVAHGVRPNESLNSSGAVDLHSAIPTACDWQAKS